MSTIPRPRLWLIRHGETAWSLSGQHTGRTDLELTKNGERQARALQGRLAEARFAHVLTSPRQRAGRTCALAMPGVVATIEPDLAEWDYGEYEGLASVDIRAHRPGWNIFRDGCPGGEMPAQIAARADRLIERLEVLSGDIALFSHGQFGAVLAVRWIGLDVVHGQSFPIGPASLSILSHNAHHPKAHTVELWNAGAA
jgi:broad specificity phosphatase PhoE